MEHQTYSRARIFEVPFLTNCEELQQGEELILEISEKQKNTTPAKRSWRDAMREEEKENKKQALQEGKKEKLEGF